MKNALVLIDNIKGTLARFVDGGVTDVIKFEPGIEFQHGEIEMFRVLPLDFKEAAGL